MLCIHQHTCPQNNMQRIFHPLNDCLENENAIHHHCTKLRQGAISYFLHWKHCSPPWSGTSYKLSSFTASLWAINNPCTFSYMETHIDTRASMEKSSSTSTQTSSIQNKAAALRKVAGITIQQHWFHKAKGSARCQMIRNLNVNLV
jgi:hypothetical protein